MTTDLRRGRFTAAATNRAVQAWRTPDIRTYPATAVTVHDGDNVIADVQLWHNLWWRMSIRLLGCNARELTQPGGPEARDNLAQLLNGWLPDRVLTVAAVKPDKYGAGGKDQLMRMDAAVILPDGRDLVAWLCANEWAAPWDGVGQKPVPPWPRTVTTEGT